MTTQIANRRLLLQEHVKGSKTGIFGLVAQMRSALPIYVDDLQRDLGDDIYDRMERDACIKGNLNTIKRHTFANGVNWHPGVDAVDPAKATAKQIAEYRKALRERDDFVANLADLEVPLQFSLKEMLDQSIAKGNKIAEPCWEIRGSFLALWALKPKPRRSLAFDVDDFMNLRGFRETGIGSNPVLPVAMNTDRPLIPADRMLVTTNDMRDCDPRGSSALRCAYNAWYGKLGALPELLKYIAQFGTPSIVVIGPEGSTQVPLLNADGSARLDDQNNPLYVDWLSAAAEGILAYQGGTGMVLPFGADAKTLFAEGEGKAILDGIKSYNTEITYGMFGAVRATMEAEHGSKRDSETATDVMDTAVVEAKGLAEDTGNSLARKWHNYNAPSLDKKFAPRCSLSAPPQEDFEKWAAATASLYSVGFIADDQIPWYDKKGGVDPRDMNAFVTKRDAAQVAAQEAAQEGQEDTEPEPAED